jgi:hypothetical protein
MQKMKIEKYNLVIVLILIIVVHSIYGQGVDDLIENIYQQTLIHESRLDSLKEYSHVQKIHFIKMDGDGEIEEQSKREYLVKIRSRDQRHRELITAYDFEDEEWINVTEKEKNKRPKDNQGAKFSLTEMVSTEARTRYHFNLIGEEVVNGIRTVHLSVNPLEEDDEKFAGDLWFETDSYALVQANLFPSENPTGVDKMHMTFSMGKINQIWLPVMITFEAEVSLLIIFKGKIYSEIEFEDYRFGEVFADSLFGS